MIAGEIEVDGQPLAGPIQGLSTQPVLLDVGLSTNRQIEIGLPTGNRVLVYVYQGSTDQLRRLELGVYAAGGTLSLNAGKEGARALVLSGRPINEPVAQHVCRSPGNLVELNCIRTNASNVPLHGRCRAMGVAWNMQLYAVCHATALTAKGTAASGDFPSSCA